MYLSFLSSGEQANELHIWYLQADVMYFTQDVTVYWHNEFHSFFHCNKFFQKFVQDVLDG